MTLLHYSNATHAVTLESPRDPMDCVDWLRQRWHGDLPESDPEFLAAMAILRKAKDGKE